MQAIGKLLEFKDAKEFEDAVTEGLKTIVASWDDVSMKVSGGEVSSVVRFKLCNKLGKVIGVFVFDLFIGVGLNGYRIAGKTFTGRMDVAMKGLGVKIGRADNRKKEGYTLVAILTAFADIGAYCSGALHAKIASTVVGGWKFKADNSKYPPHLYFNGSHTLVICEEDTEEEKGEMSRAVLAFQGCYISSRALAGTKAAPTAEKIKAARAKQLGFLMQSGRVWPKGDKEATWKKLGTSLAKVKAQLILVGKSVPKDVSGWPTAAGDFIDSIGGLCDWVKAV